MNLPDLVMITLEKSRLMYTIQINLQTALLQEF